jgi:serine/threonine protein phosphatase 1
MLENGVAPTLQAYGGNAADGLFAAGEGAQALSRWTAGLGDTLRGADGHSALLGSLRHAAHTDRLLFVNTGNDAALPLDEQGDSFWWGGLAGLDKPYAGYTRVVRGFARRHPGLEVGDMSATVDGGAGFGGALIAACFDGDGELADSIEI